MQSVAIAAVAAVVPAAVAVAVQTWTTKRRGPSGVPLVPLLQQLFGGPRLRLRLTLHLGAIEVGVRRGEGEEEEGEEEGEGEGEREGEANGERNTS